MFSTAPRFREIRDVVHLLRRETDRLFVAQGLGMFVAVIASGAVAALTPFALKSVVDGVPLLRQPDIRSQWVSAVPYGVSYLMLLLAGRLLADLRPFLSATINHRLHSRLTIRFLDHVLRLPTGYLVKRRRGELLHSLELGSAGAQLIVGHLLGSVMPVTVELFTMMTVLRHLGHPTLLAVFIFAALAYSMIFSVGAVGLKKAMHAASTSSLEVHAQLTEDVSHLETLRCFVAEQQASVRLRKASAELEQRWRSVNLLNGAIAVSASVTFIASMTACLHIAITAVAAGTMTVGAFVMATVYMLQIVRPLESLGSAVRDLSRALGYLRPLLDLLAQPLSQDAISSSPESNEAEAAAPHAPAVRFEDVHFGYDAERPVLKGVSLSVPAGSTTAIVGRSGSGKSSLARLLMRLHSPQRGRILLDERPIDLIDVAELRRHLIGLVPQETALLHETIATNIALGMPAASLADIRIAACGAQLDALLEALPGGLDTPVGDRGMQLSGGERQRIGIARALIRRPGLYVLDEPTSMLDSNTELEIQRTLRSLPAEATTIVIAHRLSTIVDADEIVVLDDGQIQERGSHDTLLAREGLYAQMWHQQRSRHV